MVLPVAYAAVVVAGVSSDVIQCFGARYIAACLSHHQRQFALEIQVTGNPGTRNISQMCGLAVGKAREDGGMAHFGTAGFFTMRFVVNTHTQDLVGIRDYRQPLQRRQGQSRS